MEAILMKKQNYILPIIALIFSLNTLIFFLLVGIFPNQRAFFGGIFLETGAGLGFGLIGIILGIISLCKGIKQRNIIMIILSTIAILAPISLVLYLQFIWGGP